MTQQLDIDDGRTSDRDWDRSPAVSGPGPLTLAVITPVQPTLQITSEHYRFAGQATAPIGTKRVTIALRGATSYYLTIPHRVRPDTEIVWDIDLVILPGISEATVTTEDHAGIRTTVRRLLIARAFAAPAMKPAM